MQKITPFLWFDDNAEEAAEFYTSIFPESRIVSTSQMSKIDIDRLQHAHEQPSVGPDTSR